MLIYSSKLIKPEKEIIGTSDFCPSVRSTVNNLDFQLAFCVGWGHWNLQSIDGRSETQAGLATGI